MTRRNNPSTFTWILLLGGAAGVYYFFIHPRTAGARSASATPSAPWGIGPTGQPLPPPKSTAAEEAERERKYRYRMIGGGRCYDYKNRKVVPPTYCQ